MMRYFAVLFVLLATFTIDAREPWPPKDGLGKDLPKELSAAYWFVSDANRNKFPYPDEVQKLFYDSRVRLEFWSMVGIMARIAKKGNGRVSPRDQAILEGAFNRFGGALLINRRYARLPDWKRDKIARGMRIFATTDISTAIILLHSIAEVERYAKQKKNQSR